ncbi:alpha/beta fold hydrolase [Telmatospirillum sp.]|uniref:alpha/beta hydrolase n=1 Tax=Telmatospirillum sp. TaxID=2079197 RepID=UPI002841BED8|nr:alpha/beta fold hydrolase [Telmatospirillum sp.]MDR3435131.1 alpha/beta fold hydrolase [Telmatospirillum sp.]
MSSDQKSLFSRSTAWQRFKLRYFGAKPWSGPGGFDPEERPAEIPDASFFLPGGSAAVLLIHGLTGTPTEMRFLGKGLASAGFTVYGCQLAGHCGTEEDLLRTGWKDWYASVETAYSNLRKKHEVVFVAGLSMGAVLSMHLAANHPGEIRGLGLLSTTLRYDGWAIPRLSFLLPFFLNTPLGLHYRFVENFPYGIKDDRLRQRVVANMVSGNSAEAGNLGMTGHSLRQLLILVDKVKKEMPTIKTSAFIAHASNDDVASKWNAEYVARHIGGPTELLLLDDSYHMITVDKQRNTVNRSLAAFFATRVDVSALVPGSAPAADQHGT